MPEKRRSFGQRCVCCPPSTTFTAEGLSRRGFLAGGVAAAGVALAPKQSSGQAAAKTRRIDVHHHVVPPMHAEALTANRSTTPVKWSVNMSLEDMDKGGVNTSVVSILNPGVWFGKVDEASRKLARECNEWCANLARDYPGRFRFFAVIPLPDTEGSLKEIEYSLDVLKAEGVALWTSYTDKYLGDSAFLPVFQELNRRKAVVYTHPTVPSCCNGMIKGVSTSTIEYATDTTRTVASLLFGDAGTALVCPDIRFIWSHSGGTIPFLTSRLIQQAKVRPNPRMPNGPMPILQRFYYEVAQGNTPGQLAALFKMVSVPQVMFGSDYPFRQAVEASNGLADYKLSEADMRAIDSENAIRIMPALRS